jgi:hypothetical protein
VENFDFETLKAACLVSQAFKRIAEKYLWRSFCIAANSDLHWTENEATGRHGPLPVDLDAILAEGCRVACGGDNYNPRPLYIRSFTVRLSKAQGTPSESALQLIFDTLRKLPRLQRLELIFDAAGRQETLQRVTQTPFPFQLEDLTLSLSPPSDEWGCMHEFIRSQDQITHLYLVNELE